MGCGGVLGQVGKASSHLRFMRWEMAIIFGFGTILGEWALPPKDLYPDLFVCSVSMEALICDVLISSPNGETSSLESTVMAFFLSCPCCMRTGHSVHLGHSCMRPSLFLFFIISF